jgi:hypothetical protein
MDEQSQPTDREPMVNVNVGEESALRGLHKDRQEAEQGDGHMDSCSDESGTGMEYAHLQAQL